MALYYYGRKNKKTHQIYNNFSPSLMRSVQVPYITLLTTVSRFRKLPQKECKKNGASLENVRKELQRHVKSRQ